MTRASLRNSSRFDSILSSRSVLIATGIYSIIKKVINVIKKNIGQIKMK